MATLIATVGMVGLATSAWAQPAPLTLEDQTRQADLVFRGVVESLEYALSEPSGPERSLLPHTFVTYRVLEVLRGKVPGDRVTLRFIGGWSPVNGLVMSTSHSPQIDLGDEDVLFVAGNTKRIVPLVGSQDGRFRVIDKQVYSEMGSSVLLDGRGGVELGPQFRLAEVETTTIGREVMTVTYGPGSRELPSNAARIEDFLDLVRQVVETAAPPGEFVNADPGQPFAGPSYAAAPPPAPTPGQQRSERAETKEIGQ